MSTTTYKTTSSENTAKLEQLNSDIEAANKSLEVAAKYSNKMTTDQVKSLRKAATDLESIDSAANEVDVTDADAATAISNLYSNSSDNASLSDINTVIDELSTEVTGTLTADITNNTEFTSKAIDDAKTNEETIINDEAEIKEGSDVDAVTNVTE